MHECDIKEWHVHGKNQVEIGSCGLQRGMNSTQRPCCDENVGYNRGKTGEFFGVADNCNFVAHCLREGKHTLQKGTALQLNKSFVPPHARTLAPGNHEGGDVGEGCHCPGLSHGERTVCTAKAVCKSPPSQVRK